VRIARFAIGGEVAYGVVEEDQGDGASPTPGKDSPGMTGGPDRPLVIAELHGHPFGTDPAGVRYTGRRFPLADVRLLAPVLPSKVVAVGQNYADHAREMGSAAPAEPVLFLKPSTSVTGQGDPIAYPIKLTERVDYEGELAVIIGRLCREVLIERAQDVIFGYTCANDVTARDLQRRDVQFTRGKGFDTFAPLGPWIVTDVDPSDLALEVRVNGEVRQKSRTSQLIFDCDYLVSFISQVMTLLPGDVISTGTPAGVSPMKVGDVVEVEIERIGCLKNAIAAPR